MLTHSEHLLKNITDERSLFHYKFSTINCPVNSHSSITCFVQDMVGDGATEVNSTYTLLWNRLGIVHTSQMYDELII